MPEITETTTDFDPAATNTIYNELQAAWTLNRDLAEMHLHVLQGGKYLDEFGSKSAESVSQYAWRKNASIAVDHCADLVNLRIDNLFRTPPVRTYEDSPYSEFLDEFLGSVDHAGTAMTDFMRGAMRLYYINGVDIVVDKQGAAGGLEPGNLAQERAQGLVPYLQAFEPLERLDWAVDHADAYKWVRFDLGADAAEDETLAGGEKHSYLTLTRNEWRLYRVSAEKSEDTTVKSGPIGIGRAPVVSWYFKQSAWPEYPKVPLSLLTRMAPIARYLLNLISQIQIDIYRNIAFLVATGVAADKIPNEITPMGCWSLPEGAEVNDIAGDVAHIESKVKFAQMLMEVILRIGKLTGGTGDLESRAASGVQVAVERTDLDNEMRMTASQAEQVERDVVQLAVSRYKGTLIPHDEIGFKVEYNRTYVLTSVKALIEQAVLFQKTAGADELDVMQRILMKRILLAIGKDDDPDVAKALEEIKEAKMSLMPQKSATRPGLKDSEQLEI